MNMKEIIKDEDLDVKFFINTANSLAQELGEKRGGNTNYVLEKLRHLEELKEIYCRASKGRGNTEDIKTCVRGLTKNI